MAKISTLSTLRSFITFLTRKLFLKVTNKILHVCNTEYIADFSSLPVSPLDAATRAPSCMVKVSVDVDKIRSLNLMAFSCGVDTAHPFAITAREIMAGHCKSYKTSPLRDYYNNFQPSSAKDLLGLKIVNNDRLCALDASCVTFPWDKSFGNKIRRKRDKISLLESKHSHFNVPANSGWLAIGPVSLEKGLFEFNRIFKLIISLKSKGYKESVCASDPMTGCLLIDGDDYAVVISSGEHRAACLSAFGVKYVTVLIRKVVNRKSVATWPAVVKKDLTVGESLKIFDRVLNGNQPFSFYKYQL
nr:hypothetical protein [Halomonas sp. 1513]